MVEPVILPIMGTSVAVSMDILEISAKRISVLLFHVEMAERAHLKEAHTNVHARKSILVKTVKKRTHANQTHVNMVESAIRKTTNTNVRVKMDISETSAKKISVSLIRVKMAELAL